MNPLAMPGDTVVMKKNVFISPWFKSSGGHLVRNKEVKVEDVMVTTSLATGEVSYSYLVSDGSWMKGYIQEKHFKTKAQIPAATG
jgi:hypothetical protein